MADPITIDTIMAGRLRDAGHVNFGRHGGGTMWQHTTIPRLSAVDTPAGASGTGRRGRIWSVDALPCADLDEAVARLNVPAVFTDEEREVLARIPAEWTGLHEFIDRLRDEVGREVGTTILMLRQKGAVENELRPGEDRRSVAWVRRAPEEASHG